MSQALEPSSTAQLNRQTMNESEGIRELKEMAEHNDNKRQEKEHQQDSSNKVATTKAKDEILKDNSELMAPHPAEDFQWKDDNVRKDQAASDLNTSNMCAKEKFDFFNCLDKNPREIRECQKVMNQMDFCQKDFDKYVEMKKQGASK